MSSPAPTIDDLPAEMICELFKHLHPTDLAACSMVNKRWHSLYAGFKIDSLVAIGDKDYELVKWSYPDRQIEAKERCHLKWFSRLLEKPLLSNLKRLTICDIFFKFDLNVLNRFSQLLHLEINIYSLGRKVNLNLPKLRILAFHYGNRNCSLSVDCPELNLLVYRSEYKDQNLLDVKHPERIRKLDTDMFGAKLAPFKNVECLKTQQFKVICKDTLLSLPKLNELHYNVDIYNHLGPYAEVGKLDRTKETLNKFLNDVRALKGSDFQFRFAGFQLNKTKLGEIDFDVQVVKGRETVYNECAYLKNYQLIDPDGTLDFICFIDYTRLMSKVPGEIPVCFFKKFIDVYHVRAKCVQDESHFLWFLKSLRSLRKLELDCSGLSQEFYDQLPESANSLSSLTLQRDNEICQLELNLSLDFTDKFSGLSELFIRPILFFESGNLLARWLGKLEKCVLDFRLKGKRFFIEKFKDSKVFAVYKDQQNLIEIENSDQIVNFFGKLQRDLPKTDKD